LAGYHEAASAEPPMEESQAYDAIRGAVFGVAEQAECSVQTLIGILEIVKAELMSTVMEDVPEEGEEGEEGDFVEEDLAA
jgi:hypothetical protein